MAWVWPLAQFGLSAYSAYSANKSTKDRNKQEVDLANTAVQRRMQDLKKAGINPALAYVQGGGQVAQTPNLESYNFEPVANAARDASTAYSSSVQRTNMQMQNGLLAAQTAATAAQAQKTKLEAELIRNTSDATANQVANTAANLETQGQILAKEFQQRLAALNLTEEQLRGERLRNDQQNQLNPLIAEYQKYITEAAKLDIPEKKAAADFFENIPASKYITIIRQLVGR